MEFLAPADGPAGAPGSGSAAATGELPDEIDEIRHLTKTEESFPAKDAGMGQDKEKPAALKPARKNPINERLRQFQRFFLQEDLKGSYGSGSGTGGAGGSGSGQNGLHTPGAGGGNAIGSYIAMIASKIQKNVNRNLCQAGRAEIEFAIVLQPDGHLENAPRLLKSSGIASCDDAIERAILQSLPLPVPSDPASFASLHELNLLFRPHDENFGSRPD